MTKRDWSLFLPATLLCSGMLATSPAFAQLSLPGGGTFDLFGPPGLFAERSVRLKANDGPFNTIYGNFSLAGGGALDWHVNPGLAIITVTKGMFNEHHSNGCVSLHEAGDVFLESEGQVHKIVNPSATEPAEGLITFVVPVGSDLVTFVPPPAQAPCVPGEDSHGDDRDASAQLAEIKSALDANTEAIASIQSLLTRVARAVSLVP